MNECTHAHTTSTCNLTLSLSLSLSYPLSYPLSLTLSLTLSLLPSLSSDMDSTGSSLPLIKGADSYDSLLSFDDLEHSPSRHQPDATDPLAPPSWLTMPTSNTDLLNEVSPGIILSSWLPYTYCCHGYRLCLVAIVTGTRGD